MKPTPGMKRAREILKAGIPLTVAGKTYSSPFSKVLKAKKK